MLPESEIKGMQESQGADSSTEETVTIDLSAEVEVKDAEADSSIAPRPPDRGIYPFKWTLNPDKGGQELSDGTVLPKGIAVGIDKNKKAFVTVHLKGQLADESSEYNGYPVSDQRNSIVFAGRPTSDVHSILHKLGQPVSNKISLQSLIEHIRKVFGESPVGLAELDWRFSYQNDEGKWVEQAKHMEQFPAVRDDKGNLTGYNNVIESDKDGEDAYANAYILKHVASK